MGSLVSKMLFSFENSCWCLIWYLRTTTYFFFGGAKGEKLRYDVSLYFAEVFGYALTWPRVSLSLSGSHFGGIR